MEEDMEEQVEEDQEDEQVEQEESEEEVVTNPKGSKAMKEPRSIAHKHFRPKDDSYKRYQEDEDPSIFKQRL